VYKRSAFWRNPPFWWVFAYNSKQKPPQAVIVLKLILKYSERFSKIDGFLGDGVKYLETYFYTAENILRTATTEGAIFGGRLLVAL
jgi:hypothetical protein